jgi:hypothetical protein
VSDWLDYQFAAILEPDEAADKQVVTASVVGALATPVTRTFPPMSLQYSPFVAARPASDSPDSTTANGGNEGVNEGENHIAGRDLPHGFVKRVLRPVCVPFRRPQVTAGLLLAVGLILVNPTMPHCRKKENATTRQIAEQAAGNDRTGRIGFPWLENRLREAAA